jgi:hypothetical protein
MVLGETEIDPVDLVPRHPTPIKSYRAYCPGE